MIYYELMFDLFKKKIFSGKKGHMEKVLEDLQ